MPRAVQIMTLGPYRENLKLVEVPPMEPGQGQAKVQVLSAGIALGEMITFEGNHAFKPQAPFTVGGDLCGRVTKVGPNCDLKVGQVVFGTAVGVPSNPRAEGGMGGDNTTGGSAAEECLVSSKDVTIAPDGIDPHVLAGCIGNLSSCYHALRDVGDLKKGERLCVLGAGGGCGIATIELGKAMGANVVACASSAEKLQAAKEAGADILIDYSLPGFKDRIRKEAGGPLDVVFDPVGGEYAEPALRALGFGGRFLVFGFAAGGTTPAAAEGAIPRIPLNLALLNERQILGSFNVVPSVKERNLKELVEMLASGQLKPRQPEVYPISKYMEAYGKVAGRQVIGKICLDPAAKL